MIEKTLRDLLRNIAEIRDRVDKGTIDRPGIYADNAPQGENPEYIVLKDVTTIHSNSLQNEVNARFSIVQIDCYSTNAYRARTLFELVRNAISGLHDLANGIQAVMIVGGLGTLPVSPKDASDRWVHRFSKDFQVIHETVIPTPS